MLKVPLSYLALVLDLSLLVMLQVLYLKQNFLRDRRYQIAQKIFFLLSLHQGFPL